MVGCAYLDAVLGRDDLHAESSDWPYIIGLHATERDDRIGHSGGVADLIVIRPGSDVGLPDYQPFAPRLLDRGVDGGEQSIKYIVVALPGHIVKIDRRISQ